MKSATARTRIPATAKTTANITVINCIFRMIPRCARNPNNEKIYLG